MKTKLVHRYSLTKEICGFSLYTLLTVSHLLVAIVRCYAVDCCERECATGKLLVLVLGEQLTSLPLTNSFMQLLTC